MFGVILQAGTGSGGGIGNLFQQLVTLIPRLVVALVLLAVLFVVGIVVGGRAERFTRRIGLPGAVMETPLGAPFGDASGVVRLVGTLTKYLFYVVGVIAALSMLGFRRLTTYGDVVVGYLPSVVGGVLVVLVGVVVAGYVGRSVKASPLFEGTDIGSAVAELAKGAIYFVSVTLGLDSFGYSTAILTTLAQALAVGIGLGVALAIGIAFGLGGQDYVADNIEEWVEGDSGDEWVSGDEA